MFSRLRKVYITYWAPITPNDGLGDVGFDVPVYPRARWQDTETVAQDPEGEEFVARHIVYPSIEVAVGGFLALGQFFIADPHQVLTAREIRNVLNSPSLKGNNQLVKAWLS